MPGLLDVAGTPQSVTVNGTKIPVYGVSIEGIAALFIEFPELQKIFRNPDNIKLSLDDVTPEMIMSYGPRAVRAVIAASCGYPGDEAAKKKAGQLPVSAQLEILAITKELTAPDGISPFVASLKRLGLVEIVAAQDTARELSAGASVGPDSTLPKTSNAPAENTGDSLQKSAA